MITVEELIGNKFGNGKVVEAVLAALRASGMPMDAEQLVEAVRPLGVNTDKVIISVALNDLFKAEAIRQIEGTEEYETYPGGMTRAEWDEAVATGQEWEPEED